jgi:hypothetical protein
MLDAGLWILDFRRIFYLPPARIFDQHRVSSPDKSGHLFASSSKVDKLTQTSRFPPPAGQEGIASLKKHYPERFFQVVFASFLPLSISD